MSATSRAVGCDVDVACGRESGNDLDASPWYDGKSTTCDAEVVFVLTSGKVLIMVVVSALTSCVDFVKGRCLVLC